MSNQRRLVRVRLENSEVTVAAGYADAMGLVPLDKPSVDAYGNSLPPKPVTTRSGEKVPAGRGDNTGKEN